MTEAIVEALDVALRIARALEALGVPYFLGGSLAASVQGEPRATNDIDIVTDLSTTRSSRGGARSRSRMAPRSA